MLYRYFFLLIFTSNLLANSTLVPCPNCNCPDNTLEYRENFHNSGGETSPSAYLTCLNVVAPLLNPLSCLLQNGPNPEVLTDLPCPTSSEEHSRCATVTSSTPVTYSVGELAPANCGYRWGNFNLTRYAQTVEKFKTENIIECRISMCTSATFLAWVSLVRYLHSLGRITDEQYAEMSRPRGRAYRILNTNAEPNELVEAFGIGSGSVQYVSDNEIGAGEVPKNGDFIQIWRNSGSGHSAIFKGFIDNNDDGRPDLICYWSSQPSTNGYANNCEEIRTMDRILIGSIDV